MKTQQKIPPRSKWKIPTVEEFNYQFHFCNYFNKHNPKFIRELKNDLIPLHLDIFGRHEETTPLLSEWNSNLAAAIAGKDSSVFNLQIQSKLNLIYKAENLNGFSEETLRIKTDALLNGITDTIKRHDLFFGTEDDHIQSWLAHALLCQIEAGIPYLITPLRRIDNDLPFEMLRKLWRELPELEQTLYMERVKAAYGKLSMYHSANKYFENLDAFMDNYPFRTLPAAAMFQFREYNIYEDMKNYENMAVEAFRAHIESYTKRMSDEMNKNFKQNKLDDYSQTEWLVLWNCGIKSKEEILRDIGSDGDESTINTAFRKMKKHGLPVRKKRKNLEDKKT